MRLLWLAPRVAFFSHRRHMLLSRLCENTHSLSPQKVTRSIYVLRCPRRPVPFAAASCTRYEDATAKGARADVDHCVLRACDPPPQPRSTCRKSLSRWKLIGPFYWNSSAVFLCDELCSFGVLNVYGVCCSGLDVQTALRRLGEFLKRGQWFSKSCKGGYEKPWCSGNALPMYWLSQLKEIRTTGNHFSSFGHTWFHKSLHVLE
jgi:hypothetical protein